MEAQATLARWRLVRQHMAEAEVRIGELMDRVPSAQALLTVPEVSVVYAATTLTELGTPGDYEHPRQVLKFAG